MVAKMYGFFQFLPKNCTDFTECMDNVLNCMDFSRCLPGKRYFFVDFCQANFCMTIFFKLKSRQNGV